MKNNQSTYLKVGAVLLGANILLALFKFGAWMATGSIAVQTEAANSLIDAIYSGVIFGGLLISTRTPTPTYPEGLQRLESFISLFIAGGILITGGYLFWSAATTIIYKNAAVTQSYIALLVIGFGAMVKVWLYRFCMQKGKQNNSSALIAAGVDNRNDVLTAGAAFIGVVGAAIGIPLADGFAAAIISLAILYSGIGIASENLGHLLGRAPSEELRDQIINASLSHPDVNGIHDVYIQYNGSMVDISMHLEVDGELSIEDGHDIEVSVADLIRTNCDEGVKRISLHLDPKSIGEWSEDTNHDSREPFQIDHSQK